ncbi:MAG: Re/Si-specific NAD(P)(+) transhydrogenase subunit alpha [Dehalococcoidales bacterium]
MKIGVPKEIVPGERRVALAPDMVGKLKEAGADVLVEAGAGSEAYLNDGVYKDAGATLVSGAEELFKQSDVILKLQQPVKNDALGKEELDMMKEGAVLITFLQPLVNHELVKKLAARKITAFSMDAIPRIARAQRMDALSSMSSISGYKAVLIGASKLGKYLPMMMTAAATMPPAKVLILGAGVAGLQAIATAKRLGAVVEGFDVRPVVKEQVESLGATFIEPEETGDTEDSGGYAKEQTQDKQEQDRLLLQKHSVLSDIIITTALIPGRPAPVLITKEMVQGMKTGSVIVDLAAETGGNCELTEPGKEVVKEGVIICGPLNLPSDMAMQASQLYSRNISGLLLLMIKEGALSLDFEDVIINDSCVTHEGEIRGVFKERIG